MLTAAVPPDPGTLFSNVDFTGSGAVVVAVSGGGDSLALLFLLHDFLRRLPASPSLLAVTIDHGLRAESSKEAEAVGHLAAAHAIPHRILQWKGTKPATGISAAAREARLALLAEAAREAGAALIFTGHTGDDQAETLAMRRERGEGRGSAGIAPATLYDNEIWFVRPLLGTRREALRACLRERGISWFEDPTNQDLRFERARMRSKLDDSSIVQLVTDAREAAAARKHAGKKAAGLIAEAAEKIAPGLLRLRLSAFRGAEAGIYAFRILLAAAGGTPFLPDEARSSSLLARALEQDFRANISRAVVQSRQGQLYLHRELRNLPEMPAAGRFTWDGRYRMDASTAVQGLAIAPFGRKEAADADLSAFPAPAGLTRAALACEPAVWKGRECLGLAAASREISARPVVGPWAHLLPSFDLAPARATIGLLGGDPLPPAPWHGHKEI